MFLKYQSILLVRLESTSRASFDSIATTRKTARSLPRASSIPSRMKTLIRNVLCAALLRRVGSISQKNTRNTRYSEAFRFNYQQVCYTTAFYVSHSISVVVGENGISRRRPFTSLRRHPSHRCHSSFTKRGYREDKWRSACKLFLSRYSIRQSLGVKEKRKK